MKQCPKCESPLEQCSTVRLRGRDRVEVIGYHQFCTNMECTFETD